MVLIQIGGLGIMVLSYFTLMVMGKKISVKQKSLVSYMLNKDDMGNLKKTLMSIIGLAAVIEGAGILILVAGSGNLGMNFAERLFFGFFHSISAFCNAGFALFSGLTCSPFPESPVVLVTLAFLIIFGGLSFGVLSQSEGDISSIRSNGWCDGSSPAGGAGSGGSSAPASELPSCPGCCRCTDTHRYSFYLRSGTRRNPSDILTRTTVPGGFFPVRHSYVPPDLIPYPSELSPWG